MSSNARKCWRLNADWKIISVRHPPLDDFVQIRLAGDFLSGEPLTGRARGYLAKIRNPARRSGRHRVDKATDHEHEFRGISEWGGNFQRGMAGIDGLTARSMGSGNRA